MNLKNNNMDIEHIANLASINLSKNEKETFQSQLDQVLEYIDQLNEVDTDNLLNKENVISNLSSLRSDDVGDSLPHELVIQNAPLSKNGFIQVPKVIDQ